MPRDKGAGRCNWDVLGCRHGRVLVYNRTRNEITVWDPATGHRSCAAAPPELGDDKEKIVFNGAVICAAASGEGHVHGDCHSSPSRSS